MFAAVPDVPWDVQTPDLAWVRREISRFLNPFELSAHAHEPYLARLVHRRLSRTELTVIDYGGEVAIDAGRIMRCYLLQVPLSGSYTVRSCGEPIEVKTRWAHIVHPGSLLDMEWTRDCRVLVLRLEESMLAANRAHSPRSSRLHPAGELIALDEEPNRSLGRVIDYMTQEATAGRLFRTPTAAAHAEDLLLECLGNVLSKSGVAPRPEADPEYVRRAERYLIEHLADEINVADLARAVDVPERTLFDGFKRVNGVGPLTWLRGERLDRARAELLSARRGDVRITDVAMRWGFQHLGRFCVAYQARFGETPTRTISRER